MSRDILFPFPCGLFINSTNHKNKKESYWLHPAPYNTFSQCQTMLSMGIQIIPWKWNNKVDSRSLLYVSKKKEAEFPYDTDTVTPVNPIT